MLTPPFTTLLGLVHATEELKWSKDLLLVEIELLRDAPVYCGSQRRRRGAADRSACDADGVGMTGEAAVPRARLRLKHACGHSEQPQILGERRPCARSDHTVARLDIPRATDL